MMKVSPNPSHNRFISADDSGMMHGASLQNRSYRENSSPLAKMKSNNLGVLQSFGLAANNKFSSKRINSGNALEFPTEKRQRRSSYMFKNSNKGIGSFHNSDLIGHSSRSNVKGSIRRSFMDTHDFGAARKSSVNRKSDFKKDDNNSIGTDYSDDDMKDIEYHQRNKELYKTLK